MIIGPQDKRIWRPEGGLAKKEEFESYSSIFKYLTCPVVYYQHYKAYGREPVGPHALVGRAAHETVASVLVEKLLRGVDLPLEAIDETWHIKWGVELYLAKNQPGGISWDGTPSPQQLEETGRQLLRHWGRDILPEVYPKAIEEPFAVRLKNVNQFLYGRFDLINEDGFVDHKTGMREPDANSKQLRLQFAIYYLGYYDRYKAWPTNVGITYLETVGDLEARMLPFHMSKDEVQTAINEIIKPAMQGIAASKDSGLYTCTCGKHKSVDKKKVEADRAAEEAERKRVDAILNPQKKENIDAVIAAAKEKNNRQSVEQVGGDSLPF